MITLTIYLIYSIISPTIAMQIGLIRNASLIGPMLIANGTCNECLCMMLTSTQIVQSFNCFQFNDTCQLFTDYSSSSTYEMKTNLNSMFYFLYLPPITKEKTSTNMTTNFVHD
jgi:hypothetical protein